jgi:predicted amidohydrolase
MQVHQVSWIAAAICGISLAQSTPNLAPDPEFAGQPPAPWSTWSPSPALRPAADVVAQPDGNALRLASRDFASFGKWLAPGIPIRAGRFYQFEVLYRTEGIADERNSVGAMLSWISAEGKPVQRDYIDGISPAENGWRRAARSLRAPVKAATVTVELSLRQTEAGTVSFKHPRLYEISEPPARRARVVTTSVPARHGSTREANLKYMEEVLDRAGREQPDVILLTEVFVNRGIPGPPSATAEPVPGPATEVLARKARQFKTYIITGLLESSGRRVYNTAVLMDRQGRLAGKYRKTHLPLAEVEDGYTPGSDYPVFDTDFGRIGILICWDNWFPEVARILRLKGAEVLFWPVAGDPGARHWDTITRARALDNGVYLVASVSHGLPSRIVDPDGEVVAETGEGLATADLDLAKESRLFWLSVGPAEGEAKSLYIQERRPDTYGPLVSAGRP